MCLSVIRPKADGFNMFMLEQFVPPLLFLYEYENLYIYPFQIFFQRDNNDVFVLNDSVWRKVAVMKREQDD